MNRFFNTFSVLIFAVFSISAVAQERIISLAPYITEILYAVGAGSEIVGAVSYSDYPAEAEQIPRIGSYDRISYESIVALQPTLVIAWQSGNGEDAIARLEELGLNVYSHEPRTLEGVGESIKTFGDLTGHAEQGEQQANAYFARLELLRESYAYSEPVTLFYQIWNEPQITVNGDHLISDVIRLCGGENIFADAVTLIPRISIESVVRLNPQVIIAPGMAEERPGWLDDWREWPAIEAAQKNQLFSLNPDLMHRHGPRILDGAERMCEILDGVR